MNSGTHISAVAYHALPGISNSRTNLYIDDPRKYFWEFVSGMAVPEQKDCYDFGEAVHQWALLGSRSNIITYPPGVLGKGGRRGTDAANEFEEAHKDKIILKADIYRNMLNCVAAIYHNPVASELLMAAGPQEQMYSHVDPDTGILTRCRPDKLVPTWRGRRVVCDIKTTESDTCAAAFANTALKFKYHNQEYFYRRVLRGGPGIEIDYFVFIVVRTKPPHLVDCHILNDDWKPYAAKRVEKAIAELGARHKNNDWNFVSDSLTSLAPPNRIKYEDEYLL